MWVIKDRANNTFFGFSYLNYNGKSTDMWQFAEKKHWRHVFKQKSLAKLVLMALKPGFEGDLVLVKVDA